MKDILDNGHLFNRRQGSMTCRGRAPASLILLMLALFGALAATAQEAGSENANGEQRIDGYIVRWSTASTAFLPRRAIETHGLQPSGRGVLNIVILLDQEADSPPQTVTAAVSARVTDLLGRVETLDMRIIEENDRVSYLGTFDIADRELLQFELQVQPPGEPVATIEFEHRFFAQ